MYLSMYLVFGKYRTRLAHVYNMTSDLHLQTSIYVDTTFDIVPNGFTLLEPLTRILYLSEAMGGEQAVARELWVIQRKRISVQRVGCKKAVFYNSLPP